MLLSKSVFIVLMFCAFSASFAGETGRRIFWAGFSEVKEKPQTAPSVPWDTQPAGGPVTLDFNNLKDPQITPDFKVREKWKDAIPGLSICRVNAAGEMQVDLDLKKNCILMHGENPAAAGYVGKRFIGNDPSSVEATVRRVNPAENGQIYFNISDVVTGAYIFIQSMGGSDGKGAWAITWAESEKWEDWKWWSAGPVNVDWTKDVKFAIGLIKPGVFQAYINDKPAGPKIILKSLVHITEFRLGCGARKEGVKVLSLAAWRDDGKINPKESIFKTTIAPLKTKTFTPTNPFGNGIQAPYPEHGFSDAMNDAGLFEEMAAILRDMHIKVIRFPGGCWTYAYSSNGPESMDGLRKLNDAYILDRNQFGWADARRYFELCKVVGAASVYELNLLYWYDPKAKQAYRICLEDSTEDLKGKVRPKEYHLDKLPFALEEAKKLARWAKEVGVKVYWEFGNEDYCYFTPKTYVEQSQAFYKAIKEVDPKAEFIVCGDGYSWSDWRWPHAVFEEMKKADMKDIACVSNHVYMFGGTGIPFIDGQHIYDGMLASWANLKYLHHADRGKLDSLGYQQTKLAITEGNVGAPPCPITQEHNMGRSLGEAEIFIERIQKYFMLVHHDMVRNDEPKKGGDWFCRILYYPRNPKGQRYKLPLDGEVMKVMGEHAIRQVIYNNKGITASQWTDGLLVSAGNALPIERKISFEIPGVSPAGEKVTAVCYSTADMDTPVFKTHELTGTVLKKDDGVTITLSVPKYSFCFFRIGTSQ